MEDFHKQFRINLHNYSWVVMAILFFTGLTSSAQKHVKKDYRKAEKIIAKAEGNPHAYEEALKLFLNVYEVQKQNPERIVADIEHVQFNIGLCYYNSWSRKDESIPYFEEYINSGDTEFPEAHYFLAQRYHYNNRFSEAIKQYEWFKRHVLADTLSPKDITNSIMGFVNKDIERATFGKLLLASPSEVIIENLGETINTPYKEYAPVISPDEKELVFTQRSPLTSGKKKQSPDYDYFEDIYIADIQEGSLYEANDRKQQGKVGYLSTLMKFKISKPRNIGPPVNSSGHEGAIQFSFDSRSLYIYRDSHIWKSTYENGAWSELKEEIEMEATLDRKAYEPSISISPDGTMLFFSSDRKGGFGGLDIYKSTRQKDGHWGQATNLGPSINTAYDEDGPYIDPNGRSLYFSSKGHSSMGGYDVFKSNFDGVQWWTPPQNMGYPINSAGDDVFFMMTPDFNRAYYSSNKSGGYGRMDIYRLTFADERPPMAEIKGMVLSGDSLIPAYSLITVSDVNFDEEVSLHESDSTTGQYHLLFAHGKSYNVKVETQGFVPYIKQFDIPDQILYFHYYQEIHHVHIKDSTGNIIGQKVILHTASVDPETGAQDTSATLSKPVLIDNPPDVRSDQYTISQGGKATLYPLENDKDIDDDLVVSSLKILTPPPSGATVNSFANGEIIIDYSAIPNFKENDFFVYQACDETNYCDYDTVFIKITKGNPPSIIWDFAQMKEDHELKKINVLENDSDLENNISPNTLEIISQQISSSITYADANGNIEYTPGTNIHGIDTVWYQVCDNTGLCSRGALVIKISPQPDKPVAIDDFHGHKQGTKLIYNVLKNDYDPDGDLDIGSVKTLELLSSGAKAQVDLIGNISIDYSKTPGFSGLDTVLYKICDSTKKCATAILVVVVRKGNYPIARIDTIKSKQGKRNLLIYPTQNDTDPDANLMLSSLQIDQQPTSGGEAVHNGVGGIIYNAPSKFYGTDTIRYTVCDDTKLCDESMVFVQVAPASHQFDEIAGTKEKITINEHVDVKFYISQDSLKQIVKKDSTIAISFPVSSSVSFFEPSDSTQEITDVEAYKTPKVDMGRLSPIAIKSLMDSTQSDSIKQVVVNQYRQAMFQRYVEDSTETFIFSDSVVAIMEDEGTVGITDFLELTEETKSGRRFRFTNLNSIPAGTYVLYINDNGEIAFEEPVDEKGHFNYHELDNDENYLLQLKSLDYSICENEQLIIEGEGDTLVYIKHAECTFVIQPLDTLNTEEPSYAIMDDKAVEKALPKKVESIVDIPLIIVHFDFDKSTISGTERNKLDIIYEFMIKNPAIRFNVAGHTDNKGSEYYNEQLSLRRANSVVDILVKMGIKRNRLVSIGKGEVMPIAPNEQVDGSDHEEGRRLNRRVEFQAIQ